MNKVISLLEDKISEIDGHLSVLGKNCKLIDEKREYLRAIRMIRFIEDNNIDISKRVVTLPSTSGHGYSFFRLMIDNEVDDINGWSEVKEIEGVKALFGDGDKVITS